MKLQQKRKKECQSPHILAMIIELEQGITAGSSAGIAAPNVEGCQTDDQSQNVEI